MEKKSSIFILHCMVVCIIFVFELKIMFFFLWSHYKISQSRINYLSISESSRKFEILLLNNFWIVNLLEKIIIYFIYRSVFFNFIVTLIIFKLNICQNKNLTQILLHQKNHLKKLHKFQHTTKSCYTKNRVKTKPNKNTHYKQHETRQSQNSHSKTKTKTTPKTNTKSPKFPWKRAMKPASRLQRRERATAENHPCDRSGVLWPTVAGQG